MSDDQSSPQETSDAATKPYDTSDHKTAWGDQSWQHEALYRSCRTLFPHNYSTLMYFD